jgi:hypothetical protein
LVFVSRSIWWYVSHDHTGWSRPPLNRKYPNILKTIEIPTRKQYLIFLFLVSSSIWWYVSHDRTWWSVPSPLEITIGFPGSDLPCTLHEIVCNGNKRK